MSAEADAGGATAPDSPTEFIVEAGTLNTFLDTVGALVDECIINFEEDGLAVQAVDPGNVAMVSTTLDAESMESYQADGGRLGIDIGRVQDITALGNAGDLLNLSLDPETRKLVVSGDGFEYDYATIDPDTIRSEPDIPDTPVTTEFVIDADDLDTVVSGGDMVSDHVTFAPDPEEPTVYVEAEGDTDDLRFDFGEDDLGKIEELAEDEAMFSLDYLERVAKPMTGPVQVRTSGEFPIKFDFEAPHGSVLFMIAPRISER